MKDILVVYFSASGVTRRVGESLASLIKADHEEIIPTSLYTREDLNWMNKNSRSSLEMNDESSRPSFKAVQYNPSNYKYVFIGFPIWWYKEPRIIDTYLDAFDLSNQIIIPFATSGGSSLSSTLTHLKEVYPHLNIKDGLLLNHGVRKEDIDKYID